VFSSPTYGPEENPLPARIADLAAGKYLVIVTARATGQFPTTTCYMSFEALAPIRLTTAVGDPRAVIISGDQPRRASEETIITVNAANQITFQAQYRAVGGECTFALREITVIPLGPVG
jgi:hypothetical protein